MDIVTAQQKNQNASAIVANVKRNTTAQYAKQTKKTGTITAVRAGSALHAKPQTQKQKRNASAATNENCSPLATVAT